MRQDFIAYTRAPAGGFPECGGSRARAQVRAPAVSHARQAYRALLSGEARSNPSGPKERADDDKTPEGDYRLQRRNPHSDYFLSIDVSYPNQADLERARAHHWAPGGQIEIHGQPINPSHDRDYYANHDWTDGCIALANADMAEIWTLTPQNVPLEITP